MSFCCFVFVCRVSMSHRAHNNNKQSTASAMNWNEMEMKSKYLHTKIVCLWDYLVATWRRKVRVCWSVGPDGAWIFKSITGKSCFYFLYRSIMPTSSLLYYYTLFSVVVVVVNSIIYPRYTLSLQRFTPCASFKISHAFRSLIWRDIESRFYMRAPPNWF